MMKKKKPKGEDIKAKKAKDLKSSTHVDDSTVQENPFDFGGLPNRDLKKNLGCG